MPLSGYVDSVLMPGEDVAYRGRLHWIIYAPGFGALCLELVFTRFAVSADPRVSPRGNRRICASLGPASHNGDSCHKSPNYLESWVAAEAND